MSGLPRRLPRRVFVWTVSVGLCALVLAGLNAVGASLLTARIPEYSVAMLPALAGGSCIFYSTDAYKNSSPQAGDVVVYFAPEDDGTIYIGRIAPCAGQDREAGLYQKWFADNPGQPFLCVSPDNPESTLLEGLNPVPLPAVRGKATWVYWPPSAIGPIPPLKGEGE